MLRKSFFNRRYIAFAITLAVMACSVLTPFMGIGSFNAVADVAGINIESSNFQTTDTDATLTGATNLLYNREFVSVFQNDNGSTNKTAYANSNKKVYTDGDLNTSTQLNGKIYYNTDGTVRNTAPYTDPKYYTDVTYDFEDVANVSEIRVYHHTNQELVTYAYQLYLSDSEATLYTADSLVATYENTDRKSCQKFKFAESLTNKKYFGLRVLVATPTNTGLGAFARFTELAVIGELAPRSPINIVSENYTKSDNQSTELASVGNLIYGRAYEEIYQSDNGTDTTAQAEGQIKSKPTVLTDGVTGTGSFFPGRIYYNEDTKVANNTAPFENCKYYTDLTYSFAAKADVHEVWIYHHTSAELTTYAYEVYLSDKKDNLYSADSFVTSYINESQKSLQKIKLREAVEDVQYIGIRFLMSTKAYSTNGSVVRINELAVMGEISTPEITVSSGNYTSTDSDDTLKGETNILYGKEFYEVFQNNNGTTNKTAFGGTDKTVFTDGGLNTIAQLNGAIYFDGSGVALNTAPYLYPKYYTDVTYSLDGLAKVSELRVYHHTNSELTTYAYQLFLSDSLEALYTSDSLVTTYVNEAKESYQTFKFAEVQKGKRYFGIRFLVPTHPDSTFGVSSRYVRLGELAVIGEVEKETVRISSDNYTQKADDSELKVENNLLYGRKYNQIIQFNNGDYSGSVGAANDLQTDSTGSDTNKKGPVAITDGGTDDSVRLLNQIYYNTDGTLKNTEPYDNPQYYTNLTYFLGGSSTVDAVWIYHHNNPELTSHVYQVYLSDSRAALYDKESLVATYVNEGNKTRQKFTFPEPLTGKQYVGIRFLVSTPEDCSFGISARYIRIAQLAVFGKVDTVTTEDTSAFDPEKDFYDSLYRKYDKNLIKGATAQIFGFDGSKETQISPESVGKLTDEDSANGFFTTPRFAEYISASKIYYYDDGIDRYLKLQYNMRTLCDVGAIALVHHSNEELRTYSYEIYLSDSKDTLWKEENRIEDHINTQLSQKELFEYDEAKQGQYIGIKIKYPTSKTVTITENENIVYTRLSEIAVFGNYSDPNYVIPPSYAVGEMTDDDLAKLGTSLISGVEPTIRFNGTPMGKTHYGDREMKFTDGIMAPHVDVVSPTSGTGKLNTTDGSNYLDIIYDFKDVKYDFTSFLYVGVSNVASTQYYTGWYQVYIAEDYDDLFLEESMAFEYNWNEELFERGHYVPFNEVKRGTYFAIRLLNPVSGADEYIAPRISEIAAYGQKSVIVVKPTNLASNMPIEAYTENAEGELEAISESNLTAAEVKKLTDNNSSTSATISTKKTVHLLYNLCNDAVIDEFKLVSNAKKYKVYASDSLDEVWTEDALIYTYKGKGTNGLTLSKGKSVRYVRFEITDFGSSLKISDIECIGGDDQLLKHKKLSRTFTGDQVSVFMYNMETKEQEYPLNYINGKPGLLFDSGYIAPLGIYGGEHNKIAVDMIVTLDDVRNIDNIAVSFPKVLPGYSPTKFEIYTSESVDEFDFGDFDEEPTAVYDGEPVLGTYNVSFRPRLARSILIRFIAGDDTYDPYMNGSMTFGITEVEVEGTPVKGMQKDSEEEMLISFTDEKTDVTLEILKLDRNDIYTKAHSIEVEELTATQAQKQSLASQGALKIVGNTVYKVKLLDIFGNEIKEADGREIRIILPCDTEKYGYPVVAKVEKDNVTAIEATSDDKYSAVTTDTLSNSQYLIATYADPDDPYFENLDVVIPDEPINPADPDTEDESLSDGEQNLTDSDDYMEGQISDDFNEDGTSPETGEGIPSAALILFVSAVGLFAISRKKLI